MARAAAGRGEHLRSRGRVGVGGDRRAGRRRGGRVLAVEPDRARPPDADQHGEEQAAGGGQHPARKVVQPHDRHLRGEGAVDGAAEQRVSEHAGARILEAELEDAVVGDRQRQHEGEPARPAVHRVHPGGLRPGQLAEDPGGGEELEAGEHDHRGREAGLQVDRILEEEPEVALRARVVVGEQAGGQRDEREGGQRRGEPAVRPLLGRCGGELCHRAYRIAVAPTRQATRVERFTTRPELRGTFGMVASTHWLASAAGMAMLERGGNAFDAAVAAGFVLQVVEPHLNGPGGEVPILLYSAERDEVLVVDGQGTAPAAATIERFRELGHELVPGTGLLAACVPGAFDALAPAAARVRHAAARGGAGAGDRLRGERLPARAGDRALDHADGAGLPRRVAGLGGAVPAGPASPATLFRNRELAATYRRVLAESRRRSSRPRATSSTAASSPTRSSRRARCSTATTSPRGGRRSSSRSRAPTTAGRCPRRGRGARGRSSCSSSRCSTASSCGDREGPDFVHTVVECAKLAFADREAWYGDVDVPLDELLSPAYADERRKLVGDEASGELRPGQPGRARAAAPAHPRACGRSSPEPASRPAATPATWTWSTASATRSRRRRAAAGCTARR